MSRFLVRVLAEYVTASAADCLRALPADARPVLLHDAARGVQLLSWDPDRTIDGLVAPESAQNGSASHAGPARRWPLADHDPALRLEQTWENEVWQHEADLPLSPAWLGYFGFECGHAYLPFPWAAKRSSGLPDYCWARYRKSLLFEAGRTRLLFAVEQGVGIDDSDAIDALVEEAEQLLDQSAQLSAIAGQAVRLEPQIMPESYQHEVSTLRHQIGAGELYQANLSHRLLARDTVSARELFAERCAAQPTQMSAYMEVSADESILSWSPEVYLSVDGPQLCTRPIKGTAPRGEDVDQDARHAQSLHDSEKERAELTMIVDMARNDLGAVAESGSVEVVSAGEIETFPTLLHRTATVQARLRASAGFADLIAASFPPASVTGAPKVRALQAIVEAEREARGPYCGTMGYWLPGQQRGQFSVLIRTATVDAGALELRVGAGIVWDSDPLAEWNETLLKAHYLEAIHESTSI